MNYVPTTDNGSTTPFCGVVASGRAICTDFQPIGDNKYVTPMPHPRLVPEISVFLLPTFQQATSQGLGLSVYWCKDGANWQLIGSLSANKPSDIFRTGWSEDPELANCPMIQLGVAIESIQQIQATTGHGANEVGHRLRTSQCIAQNLFQYMESFSQTHQQNGSEFLILPTDCLSKWLQRFEHKVKRDPQFFMNNKHPGT